ncbi:hypothetical protein Pryu01_01558 [Paraliobacillus ryukyuensis]|uniref:Regulatory protein YycI of two-component signal transduction system YycFG n=1 Tax=Paraliobacillus ryukyuensis TaxID=200904 RepID=A0A366EBZ9_9BACI|nr:two-component system regulatory protein YycI [Paraliobacillus ryukyuensis]RBO99901.1 regulatory protein YycI of two-component signal transduction system YycFG [Paraliobacillus ryukyuensis]
MQWGQIKLLFIVCFLILDIFLVQQLFAKQNENLTEQVNTSKEEELTSNVQGLEENVTNETVEAPLINAKNKLFVENEIDSLEKLPNQQGMIVDDYLVLGRFDNPIAINMEDAESYQETLGSLVLNSQSYVYWGEDAETNTLIFFQTMENPIFYNKNALLLIQLNNKGEMIQYAQTMLQREEDEQEEPKTLNTQMNAVSSLYHKEDLILPGDEVTNVQLGYYNLISLSNGEQILNPTWNVEVNDSTDYFVNAIEGHNYPQNDDFIATTYQAFLQDLQTTENKVEFFQAEENDEQTTLFETIKQRLINTVEATIGVEEK